MDVDIKTPHHENGDKNGEESPKQMPADVETNGITQESSPKHSLRQKKSQRRSRSRTPQKKADETKCLQVTLKKIDETLNGKELKEEIEKTEDKNDDKKVQAEEAKEEEVVKEGNGNDKTDLNKKEKQTKKHKEAQMKKEENKKKVEPQGKNESKKVEETVKNDSPKKEEKEKTKKQELEQSNETEPVEMDPLVISDEPDPELQFDENSDMESGKGSPVISRCVTRRSQTRNIPTPKTPKSVDQDIDSDKNSVTHTPTDLDNDLPKADNLNDSQDSSGTTNLSTRAEVGSDVTRMDYIETHKSNLADDTSYLNASRERSLSETLRCLSPRRPIRSTDDYRKRVLRINQERSDLNLPYPSHNSVEQITAGVKRKSRSTTPEDRKKFKFESPGLNSLITSPLANLRNKFKSDLPSSTPKLLGYRDNRSDLHYNSDHLEGVDSGDDEKKSWCSIM